MEVTGKGTKDKVKEVIEASGHDLHLEVADTLRIHGWETKIGPHYNDPATGKPREIDIVARKRFDVRGNFIGNSKAQITIRLFVECKYFTGPVVLWPATKDLDRAAKLALDNNILRGQEVHCLTLAENTTPRTHHYIEERPVAVLAAKAGQQDLLFEAINGCLNGLLFFSEHDHDGPYTVDLPVVVFKPTEQLFWRDKSAPDGYISAAGEAQREVNYSFIDADERHETKYFLVDVVSTEKLPALLKKLEDNDFPILKRALSATLAQDEWETRRSEREDFDPFV